MAEIGSSNLPRPISKFLAKHLLIQINKSLVMRLILVRHGETEENSLKITQGHFDSKLNNNGIEQAKKVALRLKGEKIDIAYSSDLSRTKDTAKEILSFHPNTELVLAKELREQCKGIYEGKPSKEIHKSVESSNMPYCNFKPEGGETLIDVQNRLLKLYDSIIEKHNGKTVLLVSHGGPIAVLLMSLLNKGFENYRKYCPSNTALTILDIGNSNNVKVKKFNCTRHLR